ncbi:hypothetical protein, partial [Bifidobacterium longum]
PTRISRSLPVRHHSRFRAHFQMRHLEPTLMRPYAAAQLIGKVKNATPGMVIATMAHGIEAAIEAAVSTETDATDIMGETH